MSHAGPFDEELGSAAGLPDIGGYITASPPGNAPSSCLLPDLLTFDALESHA